MQLRKVEMFQLKITDLFFKYKIITDVKKNSLQYVAKAVYKYFTYTFHF